MLLLAVDRGSMSAASRELRVPLPTLSRKISELEALLGTQLLVRTTRSLSLTDAGAAYAQAARTIVAQVEEAEQRAAGEFVTPRGDLALTAPVAFGRLHILPVVQEFLAQFPDITVWLTLSDRNAHLIDDHVDLAVRIGALSDSAMVAAQVGQMRTIVCASPALIARHGAPAQPEDLASLPIISFDMFQPAVRWTFRQPGGNLPIDVRIRPRLSVSTAEAAVDAAAAGVGVTRVFRYQAAAAIARGTLAVLLENWEPATLPVTLLRPASDRVPLKVRRFLEFAAPRLKAALAEPGHGHRGGARPER